MNKYFVFILAFILNLSSVALFSQETTVELGYCGDTMQRNGFGSVKDLDVGVAIYLPQISVFSGNRISSVMIGLKNELYDFTVFVTDSLGGEPLYTKKVMSGAIGWNDLTLDDGFEIPDKPLYVGYECELKGGQNELGVSEKDPCENAFFLSTDGGTSYSDVSLKYSPLSVKVVVKGNNFQYDTIDVSYVNHTYVRPGEKIPVVFTISNPGYNEVNSLSGEVSITGTDQSLPVDLTNISIPAKGSIQHQVEFDALDAGVYSLNFNMKQANGKDLDNCVVEYGQRIYVLSESMQKQPVCEKATGTTCGNCPRAIVAFEKMFNKYPDFIGISADCFSDMDALFVRDYYPLMTLVGGGAPAFIIDREKISFDYETLEADYLNYLNDLTWAELEVSADPESYKNRNLDVTVNTRFNIDQDETHYRIILVAIEDNVRAWQYNNYSGGAYGEMDGWENLPNRVDTVLNEVARRIINYNGIENSLPQKVSKGENYEFKYTMDLPWLDDINETEIIAMLLNTEDGKIVNSAKVKVTEEVSVKKHVSESVSCYVSDGYLNLRFGGPACREISLYGIDGAKVLQMTGSNSEESFNVFGLKGVYVVSVTENGKSIYKDKVVIY